MKLNKLVVSQIAWDEKIENESVLEIFSHNKIDKIETTPFKILGEFKEINKNLVLDFKNFWNSQGISIVSMQALLFGGPSGNIFDPTTAVVLTERLRLVIQMAEIVGATRLVFGSPGARLKGSLSELEAIDKAAGFFRPLSDYAFEHGTMICIEPNPKGYGADFINNSKQAQQLNQAVASQGFGIHLDCGGMTMEGEDAVAAIRQIGSGFQHFHVSNVNLQPISTSTINYENIKQTLNEINYNQYVSLEMKRVDDQLKSFKESVARFSQVYADL